MTDTTKQPPAFEHREEVVGVYGLAAHIEYLARDGWEPSRTPALEWDTYRVFMRRPLPVVV